MNNPIDYKRLRKSYISYPENRPIVFEKLWNLFEMEKSWPYKKHRYQIPLLEIKADFCMAIDDLIESTTSEIPDEESYKALCSCFNTRLRADLNEKLGLKDTLKHDTIRRRKSKDGIDVPKGDLAGMRMIWNLDSIHKYRSLQNKSPLNDKESKLSEPEVAFTKKEIKEFVIKNFSEDDYEDWESRFVWGEPLTAIAEVSSLGREGIRYRTNKVQKAIKEYYE